MRLYLAGPIRGVPEYNFPAFNAAAAQLREAGFEVINPAELSLALSPDLSLPREDFIRYDIHVMTDPQAPFEGIALLPRWRGSQGADLELHIADVLHEPATTVYGWLRKAGR